MSYSIFQLKSEFFLPKVLHSEALLSVKKYIDDLTAERKKIPFVEEEALQQLSSLEDAFVAMRWLPELNVNGDIVDIEFVGEKLGEDFWFFSSIAKFVKEGSYITLIGEDSRVWRWIFLNKTLNEQEGVINFENKLLKDQ